MGRRFPAVLLQLILIGSGKVFVSTLLRDVLRRFKVRFLEQIRDLLPRGARVLEHVEQMFS